MLRLHSSTQRLAILPSQIRAAFARSAASAFARFHERAADEIGARDVRSDARKFGHATATENASRDTNEQMPVQNANPLFHRSIALGRSCAALIFPFSTINCINALTSMQHFVTASHSELMTCSEIFRDPLLRNERGCF